MESNSSIINTIDYKSQYQDYLDPAEAYSFLLVIQQSIKKTAKGTHTSLFPLVSFALEHLRELDEKESCISIISTTLSEFKRYHPTPTDPTAFLEGFKHFLILLPQSSDKSSFKRDFLKYCDEAQISPLLVQQYDVYKFFAKDSLLNNNLCDAYRFAIKAQDYDIIDEVVTKMCNSNDIKTIEEKHFIITRMTFELILIKNVKLAFNFISKYVNKTNQFQNNPPVLNLAYMLTSLISIAMHDFGKFWALINIYKPVIDQEYFYAKYLNKISLVYYNKAFLKEEQELNLFNMLKSLGK